MGEMKPCPFCGHEADLYTNRGKNGYFVYCKCSFCFAQGKTYLLGPKRLDEWENTVPAQRAIDAWNMRFEGAI